MNRSAQMLLLAIVFLVPATTDAGAARKSGEPAGDDQSPYTSIAPPFITPAKNSFTTREGDSFIVVITATCLLEDDSDTQFELVDSTPGFVHVSSGYRNVDTRNGYAEGLGVVEISPQIGDAGKHVVSIRTKSCSGKVERVITFKVRVKPALPD